MSEFFCWMSLVALTEIKTAAQWNSCGLNLSENQRKIIETLLLLWNVKKIVNRIRKESMKEDISLRMG